MAIRRGQLVLVLMTNMSEIFIWEKCYGLFCQPYQYQAWQKHSDPKQLERRDKMMDDGNYQFQDNESRNIILWLVWTKPDPNSWPGSKFKPNSFATTIDSSGKVFRSTIRNGCTNLQTSTWIAMSFLFAQHKLENNKYFSNWTNHTILFILYY